MKLKNQMEEEYNVKLGGAIIVINTIFFKALKATFHAVRYFSKGVNSRVATSYDKSLPVISEFINNKE